MSRSGVQDPTISARIVERPEWWAAVDSNHLPPRYQHGALPVELAAQAKTEIRPPTGSLVGRLILQRPQNKLAGLPRGAGQLPEG